MKRSKSVPKKVTKTSKRRKSHGFADLIILVCYVVGMWSYAVTVLIMLLTGVLLCVVPWFMRSLSVETILFGLGLIMGALALGRLYDKNPLKILIDGALPG